MKSIGKQMNVTGNPMFNSFNSFNSFSSFNSITPFIGSIPWIHSLHSIHVIPICFLLGPSMFSFGFLFVFEWGCSIVLWATPLFSNGLNEMRGSNEVNESTEVNEPNESTELN